MKTLTWLWAKYVLKDMWAFNPWNRNPKPTKLFGKPIDFNAYTIAVDKASGPSQSGYIRATMGEDGQMHYKPITQEEFYKSGS
jgi:hypothetical protein